MIHESSESLIPLRSVEHWRKPARANLHGREDCHRHGARSLWSCRRGHRVQLEAATPEETTTGPHGAFALHCVASDHYQITVHANGFAESEVTGHGFANITVHLRIADVRTVVEVGDNNGVSVDADHGAGTHTLTAEDLKGMADDPDDFKRQLQVLAASSGGAPGQAIITVDGFQNSSALPPKSSIASIRVNPDMFSSEYDTPPYREAGSRSSPSLAGTRCTEHSSSPTATPLSTRPIPSR